MADPKIKYDIAANVSGSAEVDQLANTLEGLARTLDGDVKGAALQSAAALRELGARQGAIDNFARVKTEAQAAGQRLEELQTAAQAAARALAASENPTRAQTGQVQKLRDAVRAAKQEVVDQAAAVQRARSTLQGYGIDTSGLAAKEQAIRAAIAQARGEVERMVPAYQRTAAAATAAGAAQERGAQQGAAGVARLSDQVRTLEGLARTLQGTMAAAGIGVGLAEIKAASDQFANLQARVRLVTGEGASFEHAWQGVRSVAQATNADLEATGTLFTRIAQAGKDAGLSTEQATQQSLRLTTTINQAIAVSGGSAEASKAAITQLIQGLQSGVLRGEEFNSVMEQAPRLARALADGLGVTTGELRKMAQAGTLTTSTVIAALQGQAATVRGEFEQLPPTIGRALTNLSTQWTIYVGEASKANGTSIAAAQALGFLGDNIGAVAGFLTDLGKAAAAFKLLDLAVTLNAKANAAQAAARAIQLEAAATAEATLATRANTIETERNAIAKQGATAATLASAAANEKAAATGLTVGQAFKSTAAAATSGLARLAGFASGVGAAWLAVDVGGDVLKKTGTLIGEGVARLMGYRDGTKALEESERDLQNRIQAGIEIRARQNALNLEARERTFELTKANREAIAEFDSLIVKGSTAAEAVAKIGKDFDLSRVEGIKSAGAVLDKLQADAKISADNFRQAWSDALKTADLGVFETNARAAFAGSAREAERLAGVLDATTREAIKRAGLDFDLISRGMGAASRSAINDTDALIRGLQTLSAQGVDTGKALTASLVKGIQSADSEKALQAIVGQVEQVRSKLGDKVADGLLQQATDKARELRTALENITPGVQSAEEAMRKLGVTSDASLKRTAQGSREAYEALRSSGTASARELQEAFRKYATDAIAANKGVADASILGEAGVRGIRIECDETGKAIVRAMGDGSKATRQFGEDVQSSTEAIRAQLAELEKLSARNRVGGDPTLTADGFKKNADGSAAGTFTSNLPMDLADQLRRTGGKGMTDDQLRQAIAQARNVFQDMQAFTRLSPGASSIAYQQSATEMMNAANVAQQRLDAKDTTKQVSRTVNVQIGGRTHSIGVASQADSDATVAMLRELETHSRSAS